MDERSDGRTDGLTSFPAALRCVACHAFCNFAFQVFVVAATAFASFFHFVESLLCEFLATVVVFVVVVFSVICQILHFFHFSLSAADNPLPSPPYAASL